MAEILSLPNPLAPKPTYERAWVAQEVYCACGARLWQYGKPSDTITVVSCEQCGLVLRVQFWLKQVLGGA